MSILISSFPITHKVFLDCLIGELRARCDRSTELIVLLNLSYMIIQVIVNNLIALLVLLNYWALKIIILIIICILVVSLSSSLIEDLVWRSSWLRHVNVFKPWNLIVWFHTDILGRAKLPIFILIQFFFPFYVTVHTDHYFY